MKKRASNNLVVTYSLVAVVILGLGFGGAIWAFIVYKQKVAANAEIERQNAMTPKTEIIIKKADRDRKTMFMPGSKAGGGDALAPDADEPRLPPTAPSGLIPVPPPSNPPAVVTLPPVDDPAPIPRVGQAPEASDDPAWQAVLEARDALPTPVALFQYTRYRAEYPGSTKLKELDQMQAEAIDLLWWQRVNQLFEQQTQITDNIASLKKEKSELPADATKDRREQFDKQIKNLESSRETNRLLLEKEMGYTLKTPVDMGDDAQLQVLRKARDTDAFERWTQRVLARVRTSRGASAW